MWREIIGSGRTLTDEQMQRYEETRREAAKRKPIPLDKQG